MFAALAFESKWSLTINSIKQSQNICFYTCLLEWNSGEPNKPICRWMLWPLVSSLWNVDVSITFCSITCPAYHITKKKWLFKEIWHVRLSYDTLQIHQLLNTGLEVIYLHFTIYQEWNKYVVYNISWTNISLHADISLPEMNKYNVYIISLTDASLHTDVSNRNETSTQFTTFTNIFV